MKLDKCLSFYLHNGMVRGHFCRLSHSITDALKGHTYPTNVNMLLAEMAAISQCFSMDIKGSSQTTLQLTGTAPVKLALVNSHDCATFRCCATLNENFDTTQIPDIASVPQLFGQNGKLVFTVDVEKQCYQTIVELASATLQECFQNYFIQSQQIPTIVRLCSSVLDGKIESAAFILQKMPASKNESEDKVDIWHEASCFAATLKTHELLGSGPSMEKLIDLVFGDLTPIVSRETFLSFQCTCNTEKIINILKNLDAENTDAEIEVVCEYCNKKYTIDNNAITE